jgi:8-oxo-dGTP pyrophosphatase MutT (NUDIX family)
MSDFEAAVAIVHTHGGEESLLLMRRAEREDDPWSGHWSFPGGRRDPADRDLLDTALRELEEECGVRMTREDLEAEWPVRYARRKTGGCVAVTPFLFRAAEEAETVPDGREAVEAVWIPLSLLRDSARHEMLPIPGLAEGLRYPAVALRGAPLWGFTYRLICDWLGIGSREP